MKQSNQLFALNWVFILTLVGYVGVLSPKSAFGQEDWRSQHFTTSDGVQLHYIDTGRLPGEYVLNSTIVFVPGWTMPAWIWEHQIRFFAQERRVIAFDPRGQGESEKPPYGYDHSRRARDIGELLTHIQSEPVILVGWSLGVMEVMKYLEEHGTDFVLAVVLVDWAMHYENPAAFAGRYVSLQTERKEWTRSFIRAIFMSEQSEAYLEKVTEAALATPTNAAAIMIGNIILQGQTDLRPIMNELDRPALFIYSSNDWSISAAKEVRDGWPNFSVEVIEGTSHTLFVDQPDEFNRVVVQFINSLSE